MGYQLGIDLGTTWTAAAIVRDGQTAMVDLSQRSSAVPSVVLLRDDDSILVGDAAERRAATEPNRVARQFKRRIGDSTPLLLGGVPQSAEAVTARLLRWVVDEVTTREGGGPDHIVLTHPANWGEYKLDLLRQAVVLAGIDATVSYLSEPEAAVLHYASQERIDPGTVVAVYDLGGGTFDAAVLEKTEDGFTFLADPEGIERLGGIDFDEAVFQHVVRSIGLDLSELDPDDATLEAAVQRLRADCVLAKEALSTDADTSIPVMLPSVQTEVRLTRGELEAMLRPTLADTLNVTERAFRSAGKDPEQIDRILLVGGSSRVPLVAELLASRFGRPIAVDAHPKNAIALGAAIAAERSAALAPAAAPVAAVPTPEPDPEPAQAADPTPEPAPTTAATAPVVTPATDAASSGPSRGLLVGAAVAVIAIIAIAAVVLGGGGGGDTVADDAEVDDAGVDEDGADAEVDEATTTTTTEAPTTTEATTTSTTTTTTEAPVVDGFFEGVRCEAVAELCIDILDVGLQDDGELIIEWEANFVPNINDRNHAHFFWSNISPLQAGAGGGGDWEVSDSMPHLAGTNSPTIIRANRPEGAGICVTVANPDHTVRDPAIYQCWDYPESDG